jgi:hypothetical protein
MHGTQRATAGSLESNRTSRSENPGTRGETSLQSDDELAAEAMLTSAGADGQPIRGADT